MVGQRGSRDKGAAASANISKGGSGVYNKRGNDIVYIHWDNAILSTIAFQQTALALTSSAVQARES